MQAQKELVKTSHGKISLDTYTRKYFKSTILSESNHIHNKKYKHYKCSYNCDLLSKIK